MSSIRLIVAMLLALAGTPLAAQTFPALTGRVVDDAHILTSAQVLDLTSKSEALEAQTKRQFVIATVPSLHGRTIEEYGPLLGRAWHIGQKGEDNGVILLVAPTDHRVSIVTGYGAGGALTDAMSGEIIRNSIIPHFKPPTDYGAGIEAGADQIIKQLSLPPGEAQKNAANAEQQQQQRRHGSPGFVPVIFWIIVILWIVGSMARRVGGRRYRSGGISPWVILWGLNGLGRGSGGSGLGGGSSWGGGGGGDWGGGGGFSGGGGSFGGGGASGSW